MNRSSVRFRQAALRKAPGQTTDVAPGASSFPDEPGLRAPVVPPNFAAASQRFCSIGWPSRSIVIAADACPRIRCTAFGSAPAPRHSEAQVCRRSCTREVGRPMAAIALVQPDRTPPVRLTKRTVPRCFECESEPVLSLPRRRREARVPRQGARSERANTRPTPSFATGQARTSRSAEAPALVRGSLPRHSRPRTVLGRVFRPTIPAQRPSPRTSVARHHGRGRPEAVRETS